MLRKDKAQHLLIGFMAACLLMLTGYTIYNQLNPKTETPVYAAPAQQIVSLPDFTGIAALLNPTVVTIESVSTYQHPQGGQFGDNDLFEYFFGPNPRRQVPQEEQKRVGWGSGVIISPDGYILTNNHVVDKAVKVTVSMMDEREYEATVVGTDPEIDIALLKIDATGLKSAELGNSDNLRVGEWVVALGNPLGYEHSVTAGIVSGKGRRLSTGIESFIQTDTAINFGNSGGPLVNLKGEVIGINTAISSRGQNIGFAVPINMVKFVVDQLKEHGKVERGALGVTVSKLSDTDKRAFDVEYGALVQTVQDGMAAEAAGIEPYDIVTEINGKQVKDNDELIQMISRKRPGDKIEIGLIRNGKKQQLTATLSSREDFNASENDMYERKESKDNSLYGKLGFNVTRLTDRLRYRLRLGNDVTGVLVTRVDQLSDAYDNYIREGTVIVEINRKPIERFETFVKEARALETGDLVILKVFDRGSFRIITLEAK